MIVVTMSVTQEILEQKSRAVLMEYNENGFKENNATVSMEDIMVAGSFWDKSIYKMQCGGNFKEAHDYRTQQSLQRKGGGGGWLLWWDLSVQAARSPSTLSSILLLPTCLTIYTRTQTPTKT